VALIWLNGALVEEAEAMIPALDRGVLWGYGLFETMRVYNKRVWAIDDHLVRLDAGAAAMDIPVPGARELKRGIDDVVAANSLEDAGTRITITRGTGPADPQAEADGPPNVIITAWKLRDYTRLHADGVSLVTIPGGGRPLAGLKTTSYAASVAGRVIAGRAAADDALFLGEGGRVLEATGSNLFVVRGTNLITPPLDESVLPGVTRRHVMSVAPRIGLVVREELVSLSQLFEADEVVLTSSLREVYPVRSIDGREVPRSDVSGRLRAVYREAVLEALG
jgi:branched-subunit amino acid aminotransferase/4-amino-4-deoxychorismate lyase